jgi:hypothetical protein
MSSSISKLKNDLVWILEKQNSDLQVTKNSRDYILEGPAAVFGVENNNHRIYEEAEYLPHLDYLKKKIEKKGLLGELDHPEKFDVSLQNVSHIIESLEHDRDGRQVKIKIKLINGHPSGEMAKALVDAGVPLRISSRAAGVVRENKKVQIKKIFTYDLVCDSGFEEATLERINESLGGGLGVLKKKSMESQLEDISESLGYEKSSGVKIYNVSEDKREEFLRLLEGEKTNTSNSEMNTQYVTVDELNNYSLLLKEEINKLQEKIGSANAIPETSASMKVLEQKIAQIEKYCAYLAENLDKNISYSEYLAENLDKNIEYSKYLAENLDKNISYSEYLAENLDKNISYSEYLAENVDKGISYANYLAENLEKGIAYSEYLAENLDKNISYSEYLAENLDKNISYSEYLAENVDKTISYGEYLAETLDKGISYSEYIAEKLEKNILYSEYIAENVNVSSAPQAKPVNESVEPTETKETMSVDVHKLNEQIDTLLLNVRTKKANTAANEAKYSFFRFLSEGKREEFESLDQTKKQKVVDALQDNVYFSEADIVRKWDAALTEKQDLTPKFLTEIPEDYKALYEGLSQTEKDQISAAAEGFRLETPYQIKNFWQTRPQLRKQKIVGLVTLNEQKTSEPAKVPYNLRHISEEIGRKFGK